MNLLRCVTLAVVLCFPRLGLACAVCMTDASAPIAPAVNAAIFLMLGFIGTVLTGVAAFAYHLHRRAQTPLPPHEELMRTVSSAS